MKFTIMSPMSSEVMDINWLEAQTPQGNFVVSRGHVPMVVILSPNQELRMELSDGSTTIMTIAGGILEITRTTITLLLTHE